MDKNGESRGGPPRRGGTDSRGEGTAILGHRCEWGHQIPFARTVVGRAPSLSLFLSSHQNAIITVGTGQRGCASKRVKLVLSVFLFFLLLFFYYGCPQVAYNLLVKKVDNPPPYAKQRNHSKVAE